MSWVPAGTDRPSSSRRLGLFCTVMSANVDASPDMEDPCREKLCRILKLDGVPSDLPTRRLISRPGRRRRSCQVQVVGEENWRTKHHGGRNVTCKNQCMGLRLDYRFHRSRVCRNEDIGHLSLISREHHVNTDARSSEPVTWSELPSSVGEDFVSCKVNVVRNGFSLDRPNLFLQGLLGNSHRRERDYLQVLRQSLCMN
jgi:hypothetical protein